MDIIQLLSLKLSCNFSQFCAANHFCGGSYQMIDTSFGHENFPSALSAAKARVHLTPPTLGPSSSGEASLTKVMQQSCKAPRVKQLIKLNIYLHWD